MRTIPKEILTIDLPEGFELRDDVDFVHLYYGDTHVGVFNAWAVDPEEIRREAEKYRRSL